MKSKHTMEEEVKTLRLQLKLRARACASLDLVPRERSVWARACAF